MLFKSLVRLFAFENWTSFYAVLKAANFLKNIMIDGGNRAIFKLSNPGELGYTNNRLSMFFSEANNAGREVGGGRRGYMIKVQHF